MSPTPYRPSRGLIRLALLLVITGMAIEFLLNLQEAESAARAAAPTVVCTFFGLAGLCVICGTARWWLRF